MKITVADLEKLGACTGEIKRWRGLFGDAPVEITAALCEQYPDVDYVWAVHYLLPPALRAEYQRQLSILRAEYERQCAARRAVCDRQDAALWAEFECRDRAAYDRQRAPLWAECERQRVALWAELRRQEARLFGTLAERT